MTERARRTTPSIDVLAIEGPGGDARLSMEWNTTYIRVDAAECTFCKRNGNHTIYDDLILVRVEHENMPLGYLESRCPTHQLRGESMRVQRRPKDWRTARAPEPAAPEGCEYPALHDDRLLCGCEAL
jgi:hypothetical protein